MELFINNERDNFLKVSESIFGRSFNESLVHQVVVSYLSRFRQGSKAQKSRSEVSGSGKKPWRQKSTGRARAGSFQSPIWRSGGVTFASSPKSYVKKVNKKMYRGALKSIFSELIRKKRLILVKEFIFNSFKTRELCKKLIKMNLNSVLIVIDGTNKNLLLASQNLYGVGIINAIEINPIDLISFKNTLITINAMKKIERILR